MSTVTETSYQTTILPIFLLKSLKNTKDWSLHIQDGDSCNSSDIILDSTEVECILFQAKCLENKKDDLNLAKLFFSYMAVNEKYNIDTVVVCINEYLESTIEIDKYALDKNLLYFEDIAKTAYIFNIDDNMVTKLKEKLRIYAKETLQEGNIPNDVISEENIRKYLSRLKLLKVHPSKDDLEEAVCKTMSKIEYLNNLDTMALFNFVHSKILNWISQKNGSKLTKNYLKALLCEFCSNEYCNTFLKFDVCFQNGDLPSCNGWEKQVVHIVPRADIIIEGLKLHYFLQNVQKMRSLWISPYVSEDVKKMMTDAFQMDPYDYLVITSDNFLSETVCEKIKSILGNHKNKKVFLVFKEKNSISEYFRETDLYGMVKLKVKYSEFDQKTRENIKNKSVMFQNTETILKKLLSLADEDLDEFLDIDTLVKLLRNERIPVGENVDDLKGGLEDYYIYRTFNLGEHSISEENLCELNDKIVLISDSPGMGKSTVLVNLARTIKKKHPHLWVIKVDINNYTNTLFDFQERQMQSITAIELLDSKKKLSDFEKKVFSIPRKVVFMIDGIDEVSPDSKELAISLIKDCRNSPNFFKIYVTTRPHLRNDLHNELEVNSLTLNPFSQKDQVDFLCRYWKKHLGLTHAKRCEIYALKLIKEISGWLNDEQSGHLAEIPLQTRMIAEIFQENKGSTEGWQGCFEFLNSEVGEPILPRKFNLVKLYRLFMGKKMDIFMHDKSLLMGNVIMKDVLAKIYDECRLYHHLLALDVILGEHKHLLSYYNLLLEKNLDEKHVVRLGIVEKTRNDYKFIHRTFAEYFIAECLIQELKLDQNRPFQEFFLSEVLTNYRYHVVRSFLNDFFQEGLESIERDFPNTKELLPTIRVLQGLIEEGCIHLLKFLIKCSDNSFEVNKIKGGAGKTLLHYACRGHLDIVKLLVEDGADVNAEDFAGDSPLHDAVSKDKLEVARFLLDKGANVNARGRHDRSALYSAVQNVNLEMVKMLLERGSDISLVDKYGRTVLHRIWDIQFTNETSKKDYLDMIELLLNTYSDSNVDNIYVETIWHVIARVGDFNVGFISQERLSYILEDNTCEADVNVGDTNGRTPLHKAAEKGYLDVATFFLKRGANVNIKNRNGDTPLHGATANNHLRMIQTLVDAGADVNATNNNGRTALHSCTLQFEVMKFLVDKNTNINITDSVNALTPLHYSLLLGLDFVKLLVENGGDVKVKDSVGKTLLHYAIPKNDRKATYYLMTVDVLGTENNHPLPPELTEEEKWSILEYFLGTDIDVNAKDNKGLTVLHELCETPSPPLELVEALLDKDIDINVRDNEQRTPLYFSAAKNSLGLVDVLVNRGADVNITDACGLSPLHKVAEQIQAHKDSSNILKTLVEKGANVNIPNKDGSTVLHILSGKGNPRILSYLLENNADVNAVDKNGNTALHVATQKNSLETVRCLVTKGACVTATNNNGQTPLHLALLQSNHTNDTNETITHMTKLLIAHGVDLNAKDAKGCTALHVASSLPASTLENESEGVLKILVSNGSDVNAVDEEGVTPLHICSRLNNLKDVRCLLENNADINHKNKAGNSALHEATISHAVDVLQYLVANGADLNARNSYGQTCLHVALQRKNLDRSKYPNFLRTVKLLLENGIDVNSRDNCGRTVLHVAASTNLSNKEYTKENVIQLLVEHKADVNGADENDSTPLHISSRWNYDDNATCLLDNAADINAEDKYGNTALHDAIISHSHDVIKCLLRNGVNVNARNKEGHTALHLAVQQENSSGVLEVMKVLIENGADVNTEDAGHHTVLFTAVSAGLKDRVRLLVENGAELCGRDRGSFVSLNGEGVSTTEIFKEDKARRGMVWFRETCLSFVLCRRRKSV